MKRVLSLLGIACLVLILSVPALAAPQPERRVALVIGNGAYKQGPLNNPANDARDMAAALKGMGFEVILRENASLRQMNEAIDQFWNSLKRGGVGLFFFAGHGLQVAGENYLVPVDARVAMEQDVQYECVNAGKVLGRMENAGNGLNIVILDACRNNPFARSFRGDSRGLAKMDAPTGSLVAFATAPGDVAADGMGKNGLYTSHLLKHLRTPGLKIEDVLKQTRIGVAADSAKMGKRQTPWESSSLMGDFYFNPGGAMTTAPAVQPAVQTASLPVPSAPLAPPQRFSGALEGTRWTARASIPDAPTSLEFLPGGVLRYVELGNVIETGAVWRQSGNTVTITQNNWAEYTGTINGETIAGNAKNPRASWTWTAKLAHVGATAPQQLAVQAAPGAELRDLGRPVFTGAAGKPVLVYVSDPFCIYCRQAYSFLMERTAGFSELRLAHMPLKTHPGSSAACVILAWAEANARHRFPEFVRFAYTELAMPGAVRTGRSETDEVKAANNVAAAFLARFPELKALGADGPAIIDALRNSSYASAVSDDMAKARALNITGTPVTFVGQERVVGYNRARLDELLR